mgnify:CR=1 FL=1
MNLIFILIWIILSLCPPEKTQTKIIYPAVQPEPIDHQVKIDRKSIDLRIPSVNYTKIHPLGMMSNSMFGKLTDMKLKLQS